MATVSKRLIGASQSAIGKKLELDWAKIYSRNLSHSAVSVNDTVVIGGSHGKVRVFTPSTGLWADSNVGAEWNLYGICYADNKFVAVGQKIYISQNGIDWTIGSEGVPSTLQAVCEGGGIIVAVGWSGGITTSNNGTTWTTRTSGVASHLYGVCYGNGMFIACGGNGTIIKSVDGINWTSITTGFTAQNNKPCFGNGRFVIPCQDGYVLYSDDGDVWTRVLADSVSTKIAAFFDGSRFLLSTYGGGIVFSNDGSSWSKASSFTLTSIVSFVSTGSSTIAIDEGGVLYTYDSNITYWTPIESGHVYDLKSVTYANNTFFTVGLSGVFAKSNDGLVWSNFKDISTNSLECICSSSSLLVAVGGYGEVSTSSNWGSTWTKRTSGLPVSFSSWLYSVCYSGSTFVAVGYGGKIISSSNGTSWTVRTSGTTNSLYTVTYSSELNKFFAGGSNGTLLSSADGVTWTPATAPSSNVIRALYCKDGVLYLVDTNVWVLSPDQTWVKVAGGNSTVYNITFGNDRFVSTDISDRNFYSFNGTSWITVDGTNNIPLYSICYGNSRFIGVGKYGFICASNVLEE